MRTLLNQRIGIPDPSRLTAGRLLLTVMVTVAPINLVCAQKLPQGGTVVSGQATISTPSASGMNINQSTAKAIIDWNSFSVGQGSSVNFIQPNSSSAVLNRVTGSATSTIAGQITANGQVYIVNPNGIAIFSTGSVVVGGGFVGSTLDMSNSDFNSGQMRFSGRGASANVSNAGAISVGPEGYVGLFGGTVSNTGTINVPLGRVAIGSGEKITMDPTGDGFLQVALPTGAAAANGRALIDIGGQISANGGSVAIKAATAQNAVRDAVNVSGSVSAQSVSGRNGNITLGGGLGGSVVVSGQLKATGGKGERGGTIAVTGNKITLKGATIDASGGTGGGTIEIGGGPQGKGSLQRATQTDVDQTSSISSNAIDSGSGGNVTVWSDGTTTFGGRISSKGGEQSGDGGQAEVSGKQHLDLTGDYTTAPLADLSAPKGRAGTLLFDPGTVSIVDQSTLAGNSGLNGPDTFTAQFISGQLGSANVAISTNNATGANGTAGDINLLANAQISWNSNNTLTLSAARDITLASGASISGLGASSGLVLRADSGGTGIGTVKFASSNQISLPSGSVDLYYNPLSNMTVANGGTNNAAGTVNGTSYTGSPASENWSTFISSPTIRSWRLVNSAADLQNINNNASARYALGADIDASATASWNSGSGFVPLGTNGSSGVINSGNGFNGNFDGQGYSVSNLFINRSGSMEIGLFGYLGSGGQIQNLALQNASVTGGNHVATLVGAVHGGTISNVSSSGTVNANGLGIGGLVGHLDAGSLITNSNANVNIGGSGSWVGGLVGVQFNGGAITNSYATGSVSGNNQIGGLVGYLSQGTVANSYATGAVTGTSDVGGLVGQVASGGSLNQTYATGLVNGGGSSTGGLVGDNDGTIANSYFDTTTTQQANGIGSNSGSGTATALTTAQAFNQSNYSGFDFTNTWWMNGTDTRPLLRSEYSTTITNAHQLQLINMSSATLSSSYTLRGTIDMSETNGGGASIWSSAGFVPIGTDGAGNIQNSGNGFTGSLNGNGNSINGLFINRPSSTNVGLFGYVGGTGSISNAALTNVDVTGQGPATCCNGGVGALAGWNAGTITQSNSSGNVSGSNFNTGGLVGQNTGSISRSYSTASVQSPGTFNGLNGPYATGGLVGWNTGSGSIDQSYARGSVTSSGTYVGGLVGTNNAQVSESYATGAVSSAMVVGGLFGWNTGSAATSYFDNQATGQASGVGLGLSTGITGLSTANFKNGTLPTGFDPSVWTTTNGQYPFFAWQTGGPIAAQIVKITATEPGAGSAVYGDGVPSFTYTVTDTTGTVLCTTNCSAYFSGVPLIDTTIKTTSNAGSSAAGYIAKGTLSAVGGYIFQFVNDLITVTQRPLSVTASDQSKTYGNTAILGSSAFTTGSLVNGDTVSSVTLNSSGAVATASVAGSPYAITPSAAAGSGLSNYAITYVPGALTVNPAAIDVTALGGTSSFGSSPSNPGLSATGLKNGQNASVLTGLSNSFGISNTTDVGTYTMNVAGTLTNPNYFVNSTASGSWIVTAAMLNVTALGGSSFYGSSPTNPGLSATGLKNGDTVSALTGLSNSFGVTNTTNAGTYTMNVAGTLTNPNYALGGTTSSPWIVNPAPVTVTALGGNSVYGSSPSNPGLSATGLKNGDTIGALTGLSNSFGITNVTNAGSYMMNVAGSLTNSNYVVSTMISQTWSVNPAPIVVTALGGSSTYGSSPSDPGLSATGLQNGETVSVLSGLRNSFGINSATVPGTYKMNVAGALTNSNYVVTTTNTSDWNVSLRGTVGTGTPPPGSNPLQAPSNDITGSINLPAASQANAATAARENASRIGRSADSDNVLPKNLSNGPSAVPSIAQPSQNLSPRSPELPQINTAKSGCGPGGGNGGSGGCGEGGSSGQTKPAGIVDFALSKLNRVEMFRAFDHEREGMVDATHTFSASLKTAIAGSSLALTVGFVGWLLRGGALLTALLSSLPVWRQFDPMTILQARRRRDDEAASEVDRIFDKTAQRKGMVRGASA